MGLLDQFANLNPEQTQGLLAAASQILQQSGNASAPYGFGQAMGASIGAYSGAIDAARLRKQQEAQAAQVAQLRGLQIQEAQGGLQDHQRARELQMRIQNRLKGPAEQAAQTEAQQMPQGASGAPMLGGAGEPGWAQQWRALDRTPQVAQQSPQGPGAQGGNLTRTLIDRLTREASIRQEEGDITGASGLYEHISKLMPKVKNWQEVQQGGKVMFAPYFEDGTAGQPVPLEVARKLEFRDLGGRTAAIDPYTGKESASFARSQTPDSIASNAVTMRGQNMVDARAREAGLTPEYKQDADGNWLALPKKVGPGGTITALPVFGADGKPLAGAQKAPTEFQGKSAAFGLRATEADKILNGLNGKYSPATINTKQAADDAWLIGGPLGAAINKFGMSGADQRAEQAQRDFVNAVLRQESGAAIGANEFANAKKQYFPQPGDGPDVIAQKAANRQLAIQGFQANAGRAALTAPPKASAGQWSIRKVD
jgi:hypothetical protein